MAPCRPAFARALAAPLRRLVPPPRRQIHSLAVARMPRAAWRIAQTQADGQETDPVELLALHLVVFKPALRNLGQAPLETLAHPTERRAEAPRRATVKELRSVVVGLLLPPGAPRIIVGGGHLVEVARGQHIGLAVLPFGDRLPMPRIPEISGRDTVALNRLGNALLKEPGPPT